jgi:hypothetical protein
MLPNPPNPVFILLGTTFAVCLKKKKEPKEVVKERTLNSQEK